jgi:hypothetical protein
MKNSVFRNTTSCSPLKVNPCFEGACRLHIQDRRYAKHETSWTTYRYIQPQPQLLETEIHQLKNISAIPYNKQEFMGRTISLLSFDTTRIAYKTKLILFFVMLYVFVAAETCLSSRYPATVRKTDTETSLRWAPIP